MNAPYESEFRHERKYLLPAPRAAALRARLAAVMAPDPHVGASGSYRIRSLYFDDVDDTCFHESEDGTDPREKFRLRFYNDASDRVNLERKRKERGMTQKAVCPLTEEQARVLAAGSVPDGTGDLPPVLRSLCLSMRTRGMRPAVIVDYVRVPYVFSAGNVRITFDGELASAPVGCDFFARDIPRRPVFPAGTVLMEVKYDAFLPDFLMELLRTEDLRQSAFSKYYLCRKYALAR